jgi:hypothetical protein
VPGRWQCHPRDPRGGARRFPRFGYGRSRDLLQWEDVRLISVPLPDACSLWAPEITLIPPGTGGAEAAVDGVGAAGTSGSAESGGDNQMQPANLSDSGGLFSADYGGGDGGAWAGGGGASFMVSFTATRSVGECPINMCAAWAPA